MGAFVPADFTPPVTFQGTGYHLEPLDGRHNERDHNAWMSSIEHIRATPGFEDESWPVPMSLDENLDDLERHARDFDARVGFTYSVLDGDDVIGCVYIYPTDRSDHDVAIRSWVRQDRSELDSILWNEIAQWLAETWPFSAISYAARA